jgi:hypothetical protein
MGWTAGVRFPAGTRHISPLHSVQTGSGAHPAFYPNGTGGPFPRGKAAGVWSWPHLQLVPTLRMGELYLHSPHVFKAWCFINSTSGQLYVTHTRKYRSRWKEYWNFCHWELQNSHTSVLPFRSTLSDRCNWYTVAKVCMNQTAHSWAPPITVGAPGRMPTIRYYQYGTRKHEVNRQ